MRTRAGKILSSLIEKSYKHDQNLVLLPLLAIVIRLIIFILVPNTYEDAYITFRYAENVAAGNGLVYNIGEKVLGTTAPLFALLLAAFKLAHVPCVISSLAINLISEGITTVIVYDLLRRFLQSGVAAIPTLLYVFSPSNISWSISGMETSFFAAVAALSFYSLISGNLLRAILFSVFCAIIRIDGLSVTVVVFTFALINRKFMNIRSMILPAILFLSWEAFLYYYSGALVPSTVQAKLSLYAGHQPSKFAALIDILQKFFVKGHYVSSLMTLSFLGGILVIAIKKMNYLSLVIWFFVYFGSMSLANVHMHGWYYIPPLFSYIIVAGIAMLHIYRALFVKMGSARSFLNYLFAAVVIALSAFTLFPKIRQLKEEWKLNLVRKEIGLFIRQNTSSKATIYLEPIGCIGYFSQRYVYDESGLVTPRFIELNKLENNMNTVAKKIILSNPDYIILRSKYLKEFYDIPELYRRFSEIKRFEYATGKIDEGMIIFEKRGDFQNFPVEI